MSRKIAEGILELEIENKKFPKNASGVPWNLRGRDQYYSLVLGDDNELNKIHSNK